MIPRRYDELMILWWLYSGNNMRDFPLVLYTDCIASAAAIVMLSILFCASSLESRVKSIDQEICLKKQKKKTTKLQRSNISNESNARDACSR